MAMIRFIRGETTMKTRLEDCILALKFKEAKHYWMV